MKKSELRQIIREELLKEIGYTRADAAVKELQQAFAEDRRLRKIWDNYTPNGKIVWLTKLERFKLSANEAKKVRDILDSTQENVRELSEDRIRKLSQWPRKVGTGDGSSIYVYMLDNGYEVVITKGGKEVFTCKYPTLSVAKKIEYTFKNYGLKKFLKVFKQHNGADERF